MLIQLIEYYLFSDGREFFLSAGMQLYCISYEPIIDVDENDKPNSNCFTIGALSMEIQYYVKKIVITFVHVIMKKVI